MLLAGPALAERWQGVLRDKDSGEALIGAVVSLGSSDQWTALSDATGRFELDVDEPGPHPLRIQAAGYEELVVEQAMPGELQFELSLDLDSGEVVVIDAPRRPLRASSSIDLSADTLRSMPGSGNDVLKSIQSLPGVARVPFGGGGLVLRGTNPRDSAVYLDGIEVPQLYHFGNLASFYPSGMLSSLEIIPSGFGAGYGRAMGGLVTLDSKPGRSDQWRSAAEVSLIDASARADGPIGENTTLSIGFRRSYIDAVLAAAIPADSPLALTVAPRYLDTQLRLDTQLSERDFVSVMLFGADDAMQLGFDREPSFNDTVDAFRFDQSFWRLGLNWKRVQGDSTLSLTPWVGLDQNEIKVGDQGARRRDLPAGMRASYTRDSERGTLRTGLDVQGRRSELFMRNEPPPMPGVATSMEVAKDTVDTFADVAFYAEQSIRFGPKDRITAKPGLRVERLGLSEEWVVDPRFSLRQLFTDDLSFSQSIGLYHQPPAPADKDWGNPSLKASSALQADVAVAWSPTSSSEISLTGFGSQSEGLAVDVVSSASAASAGGSADSGGVGAVSSLLLEEQFGTWSYREGVGRGRSYGAELMARYQSPRFFGWLAYTLSRSERTKDPRVDPRYYPYLLDQPHVLTALGSWKLGRNWKLGGRVRYASGNPYTPVASAYFDSNTQSYEPVDGEILSARLPAFLQFDLRVDKSWSLDAGRLSLFVDIQNISNEVNPEGVSYNYDYSRKSYTRGLPIFPSFGLEFVQ